MDNFIRNEELSKTFAYLDDITICDHDQAHNDKNLTNFLAAAQRKNSTLSEAKCMFSTRQLNILGSSVSEGEIRTDPERLKPLHMLQPPSDAKSHKRVHGMFSYYSQWIKNFSEKIKPDVHSCNFPLDKETLEAIDLLKKVSCHPGVTRMAHFVRLRNLPFSLDKIKQMIRSCKTCSELKPLYFSPQSTQPFERLNTKDPCLVTTKISTS